MDRKIFRRSKSLVTLILLVAFTAALAIPAPASANPAVTTVAAATQSATQTSIVQKALTWFAGLLPGAFLAGSQVQPPAAPPEYGQTKDPDGHR